jgi:drug/metabolite transporter (DMT)-like permease
MNPDQELASWREDWLAQEAPPQHFEIRRIVERGRRRMAVRLAGHLLFALALLGFSAWWVWHFWSAEWIVWAAVIWISTFVTSTFAIWNSAGNWKSLDQSTAGFIDLARRRCLAVLREIRFGRWMVAVSFAIVVPWLTWDFAFRQPSLWALVLGDGIACVVSAAYLIWFAVLRRRKLEELEELDRFTDL